jgi:hypothetical protein
MPLNKLLTALRGRDVWAPPVFLLGFVALVWTLRALAAPAYRTGEVREDLDKLAALEEEGTAIVVGASHGKGVRLTRAGLTGQNFSHDGQDLFEMLYIARTLRQRVHRIDTVLITLSYFSFAFDNAVYEKRGAHNRIGKRIDMYSAFPRLGFLRGDADEYAKGLFYPVVTRDHFRAGFHLLGNRLRRLFSSPAASRRARHEASDEPEPSAEPSAAASIAAPGSEPEPEGEEAAGNGVEDEGDAEAAEPRARRRRPRINKTDAWYAEHAHSRCSSYSGLMRNMRTLHPELEEDSYRALHDFAEDFEHDGIDVVLFTPPYHAAYNQCFDRRMQKLTRDNARRIARETGARYLDFSSTPEFVANQELFIDSDHLRPGGKSVFSRLLGKAMARARR